MMKMVLVLEGGEKEKEMKASAEGISDDGKEI